MVSKRTDKHQEFLPQGPGEVTRVLTRLASGDREAEAQLYPLVEHELRQMAERKFRNERAGHTLQPTALIHEAYVKLMDQSRKEPRTSLYFRRLASRIMKNILIDHAKKKKSLANGGGWLRVTWDEGLVGSGHGGIGICVLNDAMDKLSESNPRLGQVVELRVFGGMTKRECAEALGVSVGTVRDDWQVARAFLADLLRDE